MNRSPIVGIAGGTGSGKTTLARALASHFGDVSVVDLDSYYTDRSDVIPEDRACINYDEPRAFDLPLLLNHLRQLAMGVMVPKPRYSFQSHTRIGTQMVSPASIVLVEGQFVLWWEELRALLDLKVFVDAPADLRLLRRIGRDLTERGRTLESVTAQYLSSVRPMHERYLEPTRVHADLVVSNDGHVRESVEQIVAAVRALVGDPALAADRSPIRGSR